MFLAYAAQLIDPAMFAALVKDDAQMILPSLILNHTPMAAQILFFGALLSAIMSTASGTLLAPSITLTENILREFMTMNDRQLLLTTRIVVVCFTIAVTSFALVSQGMPIYEMVGNAYKVPLVGAFVPLIAGLYWSRATNQGALLSVLMGLSSWLWMERFGGDSIWPPQLLGLLFALVGMVMGSLLPQRLDKSGRIEDLPAR
jgi:SSS family solute:Na+ symporter